MAEKLTRQQIYDRIRATSKDSYILEEMKRLGFWDNSEIPSVSESLINREVEINKELNELYKKDRKFRNQEAMLTEMRKARMKKARENREITKQRHKQKRLDKAAKWKNMQLHQIIYLGKEVSAGLNHTESDTGKLRKNGLPVFNSLQELTDSMGVDLATIRYLLFQRHVSTRTHYYTFEIPKKTGGSRKISAPKRKLKGLQNWVLETILNKIPVGNQVHGFTKSRSIITNARPHLKQDIVINADLKDFFPSIDYKRVKGLFESFGYSEQLSTLFALICTQAETELVEMDGVNYHVQKGKRFLPQGSPASPAISNIIAYRLDKKVQGLARKYNFNYTRYADDLSFSTSKDNEKNVPKLLKYLRLIVKSEGLTLHPEKTHIMRGGGLQKVTGIVVNEKLNVERNQLRKFRALLHNIETNGWNGQKWGQAHNLIHSIEGYIHFVKMVNPEKALRFQSQLQRIVSRYGYPPIDESSFFNRSNESDGRDNGNGGENTNAAIPEIPKPENNSAAGNKPSNGADNKEWWNIFS